MTCQVIAAGLDGTSIKLEFCFTLADLPCSSHSKLLSISAYLVLSQDSKVSSTGGGTMHLSSQAFVNFTVKPVNSGGNTLNTEALVL